MKTNCIKKALALFSAFVLTVFPVMPEFCITAKEYESKNEININSKEDYLEFARFCTLDTNSENLTVNLNCDIEFVGNEFIPVQIFCGHFNGNNHTITLSSPELYGSNIGIFRKVSESGIVSSLNVVCTFSPDGSKSYIGAVVGENNGTIRNCSFKGAIKADSCVGGIAGINGKNGKVMFCSSSGTILGKNCVGGIVGKNEGIINGCTNYCTVNTDFYDEKSENSSLDADLASLLESFKLSSQQSTSENLLSDSDMGGICGYSNGEILHCINRARIGYSHVGYNVGGIVGRQSGYVAYCQNFGKIRGRKDVGGIVGQAEPHISLHISESTLNELKDELSDLHDIVNDFIKDADEQGSSVKGDLEDILDITDSTMDSAENLTGNISDFADDNIEEINRISDLISETFDKLVPVFDNIEEGGHALSDGFDGIKDTLDEADIHAPKTSSYIDAICDDFDNVRFALEDIFDAIKNTDIEKPDFDDEISSLEDSLDTLSESGEKIEQAFNKFKDAVDTLSEVVFLDDENEVESKLDDIVSAIEDLTDALEGAQGAIEDIYDILKESEDFWDLGENGEEILEILSDLAENLSGSCGSLGDISSGLYGIIKNIKVDLSKIPSAIKTAKQGFKSLKNGLSGISDGLGELSDAVGSLYSSADDYIGDVFDEVEETIDKIESSGEELSQSFDDLHSSIDSATDAADEYTEYISDELNKAKDSLSDSLDSLSDGIDKISDSMGEIEDIFTWLKGEAEAEFYTLGDDFKTNSDELFDNFSALSDKIGNLTDSADELKNISSDSLSQISDKFKAISDLFIDEIEELTSTDDKDYVLDVSEEDIENTRNGKIASCQNKGNIFADRNTGGIAGSVSVEYSKDPEDDFEKPDSLNFTYRTKAILFECKNEGKVEGKKDCTGGICGFAEIGTVYSCENYAFVKSSDGSYVGGIAGKSESAIRKCYNKSSLYGKKYVGGIAGMGDIITSCTSLSVVEADEKYGAICGYCKDLSTLYQNYYVDCGIGAIDGTSYASKAEPIAFEKLSDDGNTPSDFTKFTITFIADEKNVGIYYARYKQSTSEIEYPSVPIKEGYFGKWIKPEEEEIFSSLTIECEYKPYISLISSKQRNKDGNLALFSADGAFCDTAKISVSNSESKPHSDSKKSVVYDIEIKDADIQGSFIKSLRVYTGGEKNVDIYILKDGKWQKVKSQTRGKYEIFDFTEQSGTICIEYQNKSILPYILIFGAIMLIIVIFMVILHNKGKKKKTRVIKNDNDCFQNL